jgi:hypothetical protein
LRASTCGKWLMPRRDKCGTQLASIAAGIPRVHDIPIAEITLIVCGDDPNDTDSSTETGRECFDDMDNDHDGASLLLVLSVADQLTRRTTAVFFCPGKTDCDDPDCQKDRRVAKICKGRH